MIFLRMAMTRVRLLWNQIWAWSDFPKSQNDRWSRFSICPIVRPRKGVTKCTKKQIVAKKISNRLAAIECFATVQNVRNQRIFLFFLSSSALIGISLFYIKKESPPDEGNVFIESLIRKERASVTAMAEVSLCFWSQFFFNENIDWQRWKWQR